MCKWKEAYDLGLWGSDAEQIVYALYQSFAMVNGKNGPKRFSLEDFKLHDEQQVGPPVRDDQPMTQEGWDSFAGSIRSWGQVNKRSEQ